MHSCITPPRALLHHPRAHIKSLNVAMIILYRYHLQARYHKPGKKCRHFSYPDISLIRYGSDRPVDKGVRIIEVALYYKIHVRVRDRGDEAILLAAQNQHSNFVIYFYTIPF
jgi:hypothetical protein